MEATNQEGDEVVYRTFEIDPDGKRYAIAPLTERADQRIKIVETGKVWVIPIVFVPGIMGTNLKLAGQDTTAWRAPNADLRGAGDLIGALFSYLFKNAKQRQRELDPRTVELDPRGPVDTAGTDIDAQTLAQRYHWGTVMRSSYHPMMGLLYTTLNSLYKSGVKQAWAESVAVQSPAHWGASGAAALTENEIKHAARYRFEVWCAGYNWLQSNRDSGADLKDFIERTVLPYYEKNDMIAKKVIVVTHSMGGLVSRALTQIHGCDSVLGVVHGVQPATGAPATYKRMRAGFEGAEQVVLGRNAGEVTAVLASAPGGLELLPSHDYNGGKPWLKVRDARTKAEPRELQWPKNGDPYTEIYASPEWYGLVPEANNVLIDPAGLVEKAVGQRERPRDAFLNAVDLARKFHREISSQYHPETYAHYGAEGGKEKKLLGVSTAHRLTWGEVVWQGAEMGLLDPAAIRVSEDDHNGEITLTGGRRLNIAPPDTPGDGTVPEPSGAAPALAGVKASFRHNRETPAGDNMLGYEHQTSYNDSRAHFATLYGIVKIAQKADWRP